MSFQQTAGSAVTFGRNLLPSSRRIAGVLTGGILIGTMLTSAAGAGSQETDRHVVKAPEAEAQTEKIAKAAKSGETIVASANRKKNSAAPAKPTPKPVLVGATRSLKNARSGDWSLCRKAASAIEGRVKTPKHLLSAVTLTETGRAGPDGKSLQAWPWTINAAGKGYVFTTKEEALRAVRRLLAKGQRSIDIGCMQVNLKYHPRAFTSLEEAFDPVTNLAYGADFLTRLKKRHGSWDLAVQHYHSITAEHRQTYAKRFNKLWALERRRMAAAARKAVKTATVREHSGVILAQFGGFQGNQDGQAALLTDFNPLHHLRPLVSLVTFNVNVDALRRSAEDSSRYLRRLAGHYPVILDTRMRSASIAGPLPVN